MNSQKRISQGENLGSINPQIIPQILVLGGGGTNINPTLTVISLLYIKITSAFPENRDPLFIHA